MPPDLSLTRVTLVTPTGATSLVERQSLLRQRLLAAFRVLLFGCLIFAGREVLGWALEYYWGEPGTLARHRSLFWVHGGVIALLAILVAVLKSSLSFTWHQLRGMEIVGFLSVAGLLGLMQYHEVMYQVRNGDAGLALAALRTVFFAYFLLMVVYGLFVPHHWKTALWIVVSLGAIAPTVSLFSAWWNPEFRLVCSPLWTFEHLSTSAFFLLLGMVTVVYGSHVMYSLRREVSAARQLGQYRLVERIGKGGMGEVWRAEHQMLVRPAAIKLIRPEVLQGPEETVTAVVSRFEREARAMARLQSPHTVQVYDFGLTDDGALYYVMELLDGLDLETLVERFDPIPAERVVYLLLQACESLAEAHCQGLVHRDVKPANLYTCRCALHYDFLKVLDFGLVKQVGGTQETRLTLAGSVTGTPSFMAPEMATDASRADHRADLYSLGCVAYWLLTGVTVFDGETPLQVIVRHLQDPPVPPSRRAEVEVPVELEAVILRCLAKRPEERFQSAGDLAKALRAVPLVRPWNEERAKAWWQKHFPARDVPVAKCLE